MADACVLSVRSAQRRHFWEGEVSRTERSAVELPSLLLSVHDTANGPSTGRCLHTGSGAKGGRRGNCGIGGMDRQNPEKDEETRGLDTFSEDHSFHRLVKIIASFMPEIDGPRPRLKSGAPFGSITCTSGAQGLELLSAVNSQPLWLSGE